MKKFLMFFVFVFVCLFAMSPFAWAVATGENAPVFSLNDTNGKAHSLADFRGKYVVLEWLNHDCPFVKKHYGSGNMQALQKTYGAKDVVWLSINSSAHGKQGHYHPQEANQLTQQKGASPSAVLMDFDGDVGRLYGAKTTPHIFIIDPKGTLIYQGAIDSVPSANPGDIQGATNYVQLALDEAMAGKSVSASTTKAYGCSVKY